MIYAIRAVGTPFVKLGVSVGIGHKMQRIATLQTGCPFELVLIAQADWPNIEERRIHSRLKRLGLHARGEWFKDEGETNVIIDLLRDGRIGLDAWHHRITITPNPRLARALALHLV